MDASAEPGREGRGEGEKADFRFCPAVYSPQHALEIAFGHAHLGRRQFDFALEMLTVLGFDLAEMAPDVGFLERMTRTALVLFCGLLPGVLDSSLSFSSFHPSNSLTHIHQPIDEDVYCCPVTEILRQPEDQQPWKLLQEILDLGFDPNAAVRIEVSEDGPDDSMTALQSAISIGEDVRVLETLLDGNARVDLYTGDGPPENLIALCAGNLYFPSSVIQLLSQAKADLGNDYPLSPGYFDQVILFEIQVLRFMEFGDPKITELLRLGCDAHNSVVAVKDQTLHPPDQVSGPLLQSSIVHGVVENFRLERLIVLFPLLSEQGDRFSG